MLKDVKRAPVLKKLVLLCSGVVNAANMTRLILTLILLLFAYCGFSQTKLRGKVREEKTYVPIGNAQVENLNTHFVVLTDTSGAFSTTARVGDRITISAMGYAIDTLYVTDLTNKSIYLVRQDNLLKEVKVNNIEFKKGTFAAKPIMGPLGTDKVRYQTDKNGNPIGGVQFSPSSLFAGKPKEDKIAEYAKQDEIYQVFNATTLTKLLSITGQELNNFVIMYMPDAKTFFDKDFNLTNYVNKCYQEFIKIPAEQRRSAQFLSLKQAGGSIK